MAGVREAQRKPRPLWPGCDIIHSLFVMLSEVRRSTATENESKHPEDVSSAMLLQGISARSLSLEFSSCGALGDEWRR